jgi:hypothetical protein
MISNPVGIHNPWAAGAFRAAGAAEQPGMSTSVSVEREDGRTSRTVTQTADDGRTRSVVTEMTRSETGFERTTTVTGLDGKTAQRSISVAYDGDSVVRTIIATTPDGETRSIETRLARDESGVSLNHAVSLLDGSAIAFVADLNDDGTGVSRELTRTTAEGEVYSTYGAVEPGANDAVLIHNVWSGPGGTHSVERSFGVDENGKPVVGVTHVWDLAEEPEELADDDTGELAPVAEPEEDIA